MLETIVLTVAATMLVICALVKFRAFLEKIDDYRTMEHKLYTASRRLAKAESVSESLIEDLKKTVSLYNALKEEHKNNGNAAGEYFKLQEQYNALRQSFERKLGEELQINNVLNRQLNDLVAEHNKLKEETKLTMDRHPYVTSLQRKHAENQAYLESVYHKNLQHLRDDNRKLQLQINEMTVKAKKEEIGVDSMFNDYELFKEEQGKARTALMAKVARLSSDLEVAKEKIKAEVEANSKMYARYIAEISLMRKDLDESFEYGQDKKRELSELQDSVIAFVNLVTKTFSTSFIINSKLVEARYKLGMLLTREVPTATKQTNKE